jgi:hypothetical protein
MGRSTGRTTRVPLQIPAAERSPAPPSDREDAPGRRCASQTRPRLVRRRVGCAAVATAPVVEPALAQVVSLAEVTDRPVRHWMPGRWKRRIAERPGKAPCGTDETSWTAAGWLEPPNQSERGLNSPNCRRRSACSAAVTPPWQPQQRVTSVHRVIRPVTLERGSFCATYQSDWL